MPTTEANAPLTNTPSTCPLCSAPLDPASPGACPRCDWTAGASIDSTSGTFRDRVAVCLSVIPGLGHIYKGHRATGVLYMIGSIFAFAFCFLAGTASAGWGMLLLPLYWFGVMLQVYFVEDLVVTPRKPR